MMRLIWNSISDVGRYCGMVGFSDGTGIAVLIIMMLWCGYHVDNAVDDDVDGDNGVYIAFSWIGFADAHLQLQQNLIESAFCNSMIRSNIFLSGVRRRKTKPFYCHQTYCPSTIHSMESLEVQKSCLWKSCIQ